MCNQIKLEISSFVMNFNSGGWGVSKGTVLCGGQAWWWRLAMGLAGGLQTFVAGRSKVPNLKHKLRARIGGQ